MDRRLKNTQMFLLEVQLADGTRVRGGDASAVAELVRALRD